MYWKEKTCRKLNNKYLGIKSNQKIIFKIFPLHYVYVSGKDSCHGDSGGPLVYRKFSPWYQVGISSFGTRKCGSGEGSVYTRVTSFLSWIESKLEP